MKRKMASCALLAILIISLPSAAFAGTFVGFGPQNYTRGTASPVVVTNAFTVLNPNTSYTLKINNGGLVGGQFEKVSSAVISVNGVQIVGPSEFSQNVTLIEKPITLAASNQLSVELRGKPGGGITIQIIGVDNDPPTITASVNPLSNAAGWNNTDVTVSFACLDATSGIASCPNPISLSTEGANQVVSGTAVDRAGNTASISVTLNVDKTPPTLSPTITPQPNPAGWHKSDVTVSFTCSDSLSGIAVCPLPVTVNAEGASQIISGTATDLASNSASTNVSISLDKTAPVVAIASPSNGATVSSSPVNVTGTASESLSGIATVLCNGNPASLSAPNFSCDVPLTNGPNTITVEASDRAGNASTASITVNLGEPLQPQSPPVVFGPRIFTLPNEAVSFLVTNPVGPFWLQVGNGESVQHAGPGQPGIITMQNLVTSGEIRLNGSVVASASDFDHNVTRMFGFQKDITLTSVNTLEVQIQGPAGSFITVEIREADPNPTVSNSQVDLSGTNMGDEIFLSWDFDDSAAEYVVFRAPSLSGPWTERFRFDRDAAMTGGVKVDVTPDARLMDLCYKVEARDAAGLVIRLYEPICVPKFVATQTQSFAPRSSSPIKKAALSPASENVQQTLRNFSSFSFFPASASDSAYTNNDLCIIPGNFLTVEIREADPNPTVSNSQVDLSGTNMGDEIFLSWDFDDSAAEYVVFRAPSLSGPWTERFRFDRDAAMTGGVKVDVTPDARLMDLCYKLEARDGTGRIVRRYEPICVPKFVEPRTQSFLPRSSLSSQRENQQVPLKSALHLQAFTRNDKSQGSSSRSPILLASLMLLAAPEPTDPRANELCFGNPDEEFEDFASMGNDKTQIQQFLETRGGFMKKVFRDVRSDESPEGEPIDAAREIFEASQTYRINPQVFLVTLQKEHEVLTTKNRPLDNTLKDLAGWDQKHVNVPKANKSAQEQIWDMAAQLRRDFDRLSQGKTTGPVDGAGWKVGEPKDTQDPLSVRPASKPVAVLYAFTPWVGKRHGGRPDIGGNGAFCQLWEQYKFRRQPVAISPQNPTLTCGGADPSVTFTASGGRPGPDGYTWSITGPNLTTTVGVLTVTGVNKQNVQLKPPTNTGSGVAGVAYDKHGSVFTTGCAEFTNCSQRVDYGCNNQVLGAPNPAGHGPHPGAPIGLCAGVVFGSPQCLPLCNCVPCDCGNGSFDAANRFGASFDLRTQEMIDAGCRPCVVEMQGVTVTVTDAAGASATNTVKAQ